MLNTRIHGVDKVFLAATLLTVASLKSEAITVQEVGVSPYETPTISCAGIGTVTVYAGVVNLVVDGSSMNGFCIDPFHFSVPSSTGYSYVPLTSAPKDNIMSPTTALLIERLWGNYYPTALNSASAAAGLQIAIWELVGGGSFHLVSANDYGASGFLTTVENSGYSGPVASLLGLTGPGQDYTVLAPPGSQVSTVPDTGGTVTLMGIALCGLAMISRKRVLAYPQSIFCRQFRGFNASVRRSIRKAQRAGVTSQVSQTREAMRDYYSLHCMTRKRHGLPSQSFAFFDKIYEEVLSRNLGAVVLAFYQGLPIAGNLYLRCGDRAIYKFGASNKAFQHLRGSNLAMWEGIRWLIRSGSKVLDFGRTSLSNQGLRKFKLGWGAVEKPLRYFKYDFRMARFVTQKEWTHGCYNSVFKAMPLFLSRPLGAALYRLAA